MWSWLSYLTTQQNQYRNASLMWEALGCGLFNFTSHTQCKKLISWILSFTIRLINRFQVRYYRNIRFPFETIHMDEVKQFTWMKWNNSHGWIETIHMDEGFQLLSTQPQEIFHTFEAWVLHDLALSIKQMQTDCVHRPWHTCSTVHTRHVVMHFRKKWYRKANTFYRQSAYRVDLM